ncbi:hypothetical protein ACFWOL_16495 [Streptomyces sp. NPDC058442]|uniref:hypothetical protein n=1 Tax=Streptomyces sp. NPDC058442 TaxID=3346503 RepID=UPI003669EB6D
MVPLPTRTSSPTVAETNAWADVLVRRRLLHAAVPVPSSQWLVQHEAAGPVRVFAGPADVVDLAVAIQLRTRSPRPDTR